MTTTEEWEEITIYIKKGDIITSEKGFLVKDPIRLDKDTKCSIHKTMEYLGAGFQKYLDKGVYFEENEAPQ